ncbi:MAG: serine/threonine-protein kinase [Planctomycetota bacterium]
MTTEQTPLHEESCAQETLVNESTPIIDSVSNILQNGMCVGDQLQYQIQGRIGKGGMGSVFLALNKQTQEQVAIKFVRFSSKASPELMTIFRQRFEREIEILSRIDHPNIIKILGSGVHAYKNVTLPYFCMEYVRGEALDRLRSKGSLSISAILEMIIALSNALALIHQKKIVHRDIKPANIFITESGVPKLIDFGLAKVYEETEDGSSRLTFSQMILGTFEFMAPEQGTNPKEVHPQSDIYSLGHVLYWLLTGKLAVDTSLLRQCLEERDFSRLFKELSSQLTRQNLQFDHFIDTELRNICQKALHLNLQERYATAKDFGDALRSYQSHLTQKEQWEHHFLFPTSQSRPQVPISIDMAGWFEAQLEHVALKNENPSSEEANWAEFVPFGNSCLLEAKKTIQVNQQLLNPGDSIYLQDGDFIQIHSSTFIYKKAPEDHYFMNKKEDDDPPKKI